MTTDTSTTADVTSALHQTPQRPDQVLHSTNAGVVVERVAQVRSGFGARARQLSRQAAQAINREHAGAATVFVYEETFGTKDRLHWLLHLRSLDDYAAVARGSDFLACHGGESWDQLFVDGSARETVMLPHRWGMFGAATEAMTKDPSMSPLAPGESRRRFVVEPAQAQTSLAPELTLNSATCGILMRRVIDFTYPYRAEARVFARTAAENVNINMDGLASAFVYEEMFGSLDRIHFLIHIRSLPIMYLLMGLDARTDPNAPRHTTYVRNWVSPEKGGGGWDKMTVQGSTRDSALTAQFWGTTGG
jgi:hypothetical protein